MSGTDIREILAEEPQVPRHKDALDSLVRLGSKLLRDCLRQAENPRDVSTLLCI